MVDPVADEMLAKVVVDSHFKSQPKLTNIDDRFGPRASLRMIIRPLLDPTGLLFGVC